MNCAQPSPAPEPTGPTAAVELDRASVETVVAAASRAPSIHNTQPWRWNLHNDVLDIRADRSRQLNVADRDGQSLLISCGAAVELTALALHAQGWMAQTSLMRDDDDTELLASVHLGALSQPYTGAEERLAAACARRSDRRVFGPEPVPVDVVDRLRDVTAAGAVHAFRDESRRA